MSNQPLFEKLQLKDEKNILIQGLPSSVEKQFVKVNFAKNVTPLIRSKKLDFALVFALSQQQLNNILKEVFPAITPETKLWIAYPKTTSKIVSDLNRESSWEVLTKNDYESVRQVTLDHVWSAIRFQKTDQIPNKDRSFSDVKSLELKSGSGFEKRLIALPVDLERIFTNHEEAKEFFTSLSISNQKEYLSWIQGAKKAETRQIRLETAVEKLMAGKRNPTEK
jgi:uncharacterized protein YdeI (YjbR/CyaY-like superfamily)